MNRLPLDILRFILWSFNDAPDIAKLERVCKQWRLISRARLSITSNRVGTVDLLSRYPNLINCHVQLTIDLNYKNILRTLRLKYVEFRLRVNHIRKARVWNPIRSFIKNGYKAVTTVKLFIVGYDRLVPVKEDDNSSPNQVLYEIMIDDQLLTIVYIDPCLVKNLLNSFDEISKSQGQVIVMKRNKQVKGCDDLTEPIEVSFAKYIWREYH